jgi:type I restriction enzyme, R subunit
LRVLVTGWTTPVIHLWYILARLSLKPGFFFAVRSEQLGLTEEEIAFYDALEVNDSAVQVLGDETLRAIARELVRAVRNNVTIDWTLRENVRAKMRVIVKRILRRYGYPPDKQEKATQTVLEQAEVLCRDWAVG